MYDNGIIACNMGNRTKFIEYKCKAGLYTKICIAHLNTGLTGIEEVKSASYGNEAQLS